MEDFTKEEIAKAVKKNKQRFKAKDLKQYKEILLEIRAKAAGELRHLEEDNLNTNQKEASGDLSGYSLHMADQASDNYDRELYLGLASTEQNLLNEIDHALKKIDENDGSYGLCEKTLKPIAKKRLAVQPYARLCIEAKEEEEREQRRR